MGSGLGACGCMHPSIDRMTRGPGTISSNFSSYRFFKAATLIADSRAASLVDFATQGEARELARDPKATGSRCPVNNI